MSDFTAELADGFNEAADGVGMGVTLTHKGRPIRAIEDTNTAGLEYMDGGGMDEGTRVFVARKIDFLLIQPKAEDKIELVESGAGGAAGGVLKLRIKLVDTKQIEPTIRLVCAPPEA